MHSPREGSFSTHNPFIMCFGEQIWVKTLFASESVRVSEISDTGHSLAAGRRPADHFGLWLEALRYLQPKIFNSRHSQQISVLTRSLSQWVFLMRWRNALWGPTKAMLIHNSHSVIARFGEKARFASESVRSVRFFLLGRS
jgi:hypothetical protein